MVGMKDNDDEMDIPTNNKLRKLTWNVGACVGEEEGLD